MDQDPDLLTDQDPDPLMDQDLLMDQDQHSGQDQPTGQDPAMDQHPATEQVSAGIKSHTHQQDQVYSYKDKRHQSKAHMVDMPYMVDISKPMGPKFHTHQQDPVYSQRAHMPYQLSSKRSSLRIIISSALITSQLTAM